MNTLAVDLGGTNTRVAVVAPDGTIAGHGSAATAHGDAEPTKLIALMRLLAPGCERAVVGVPGRVDHALGTLDHAPNLNPAWAPHLSEAALSAAVGLPVSLANDADLAAVGEAWFGAARGYADVVFLTMSTGVGAGVLLGRRLVRGRRSAAEVGHMVIDEGAFARGLPSTFEHRASGTGLARTAAWLGVAAEGEALVNDPDPRAVAALDATIRSACVGVRNVAFAYSPEVIVVGGGFGLIGERLLAPMRAHLAAYGPPAMPIEVVSAALGTRAGLVGAAGWAEATR